MPARALRPDERQLSMPDNWERAIADARGEYVGILTDRSVFRRDALSLVHAEIEHSGTPLVGWFRDQYGRDPAGHDVRAPGVLGRALEFESAELLYYFAARPSEARRRSCCRS